jgi:hypothetical protein
MSALRKSQRSRRWYGPRSLWQSIAIRPRVYSAALIGVAVFLLLPSALSGSLRAAVA